MITALYYSSIVLVNKFDMRRVKGQTVKVV